MTASSKRGCPVNGKSSGVQEQQQRRRRRRRRRREGGDRDDMRESGVLPLRIGINAALGNGGSGRLASCFLDSLATLNYPAWGYRFRYNYGLFKQLITKDGQEEVAESWLEMGNPWEIVRHDVSYPVKFYGEVILGEDGKKEWVGGEDIIVVAYDVPILGYKTNTTINLRLWSTKVAPENLDFRVFNAGEHAKAYEALKKAEKGLDGLKHLQELYLDYSFIDKIFLHNVGVMSSLRVLTLWNINLNGTLPNQGWCELSNLQELDLSENGFNGMLPSSFGISNNHMSGRLPRWMGNMSDLMGISMFSNHFEGPIPVEFCKLGNLEFLDLSVNNLSGSIPSCFNQSTVKHVHLNRNQLSGLMAHTALVTLDLSDNHLTGTIPSWIGSLHVLSILPLKFNNFEGEIPIQLCQLKQLSILDLSENNFSGSIPLSFCEIPFETTHEKSSLEIIAMAGMAMVALWSFVDGSKSIGDHYQMDAVNGFGSITFPSLDVQQKVEFTTKYESYAYKGNILDYISIPSTLSQLKQIESLDLFYNRLNGKIPSQLIELDKLEVFSVAYNNLSGATPDQKA
ncbi:unnamed protein product [Camellia sinensis]